MKTTRIRSACSQISSGNQEKKLSVIFLSSVLEIAVKCNVYGTGAVEADIQLRDNQGTTMVQSHDDLADKFLQSPFDFKAEEEEFYYLKTVLAKKMSEFGSMNRLYSYIKRKINQFEQYTPDQVAKDMEELRDYFPKTQQDFLTTLMKAKTEGSDNWRIYDTILGFTLIEPRILKKHKFAFIYSVFKEDPKLSIHVVQTNLLTQTNHAQVSKKTLN